MPFINSKVTVKLSEEKKEVLKSRLGQAIALIPGKSEQWLMVGFEDEYSLYFRGDACEKAAFVDIKLFGAASKEAYAALTKEVCAIFKEELGIPGDKLYVTYEEVHNWGYDGMNF